ncbi:MAG: hypothetical protein JEZ07_15275 [Phycisphaerae bacterium]|nr:hypothetical protein [Phycisphaerae bacterium]
MGIFDFYGLGDDDGYIGGVTLGGPSGGSSGSARSSVNANRLERQVKQLEANLAKSLLINEALWELMRDKMGITEQQLNDKLYEVDMRDGVLDGKNQRNQAANCPKCNRKVSPRHSACIYCGQEMEQSVFKMT